MTAIAAVRRRDRLTVSRELTAARKKLESTQRGLERCTNAENIAIRERGERAMQKKITELEAELATAPELPAAARHGGFVLPDGCTLAGAIAMRADTPAQDEIDALAIPAFLRR
jgi:hypothetical protein